MRSPSLGDVTPDGADTFQAKQKEFRDSLEAARKRREEADRALRASVGVYSSSPSVVSASSGTRQKLGLGSLSTNAGAARRQETDASTSGKKKGFMSNLIHGTAEGQIHDKEIERSFSQMLARGKYVHSIVFHDVKPDKVDEYVELVGSWYPKIAGMEENKVNLVGSWRTEVGDCDTFGLT